MEEIELSLTLIKYTKWSFFSNHDILNYNRYHSRLGFQGRHSDKNNFTEATFRINDLKNTTTVLLKLYVWLKWLILNSNHKSHLLKIKAIPLTTKSRLPMKCRSCGKKWRQHILWCFLWLSKKLMSSLRASTHNFLLSWFAGRE